MNFGGQRLTNPSSLLRRERVSTKVKVQKFCACRMIPEPLFSLSLSQVGRKTCAVVSGYSASHSLASELVESNDGHEEIIKVSLVHPHLFSLHSCSLLHVRGSG